MASILTSIADLGFDFKPALTRADTADLPLRQLPMMMFFLFCLSIALSTCAVIRKGLRHSDPSVPRQNMGTLEAVDMYACSRRSFSYVADLTIFHADLLDYMGMR